MNKDNIVIWSCLHCGYSQIHTSYGKTWIDSFVGNEKTNCKNCHKIGVVPVVIGCPALILGVWGEK